MMDDREITLALAADLRALLPVVRHHITMLSTPATARQDPTAGSELARLTGAMAEVCAQAESDDCALILYALHERFAALPGALHPRFAAAVLDAITWVQERVDTMGALVSPRAPTGIQRAQAERFAQALAETRNASSGELGSPASSSSALSRPPTARDGVDGTHAANGPAQQGATMAAHLAAGMSSENTRGGMEAGGERTDSLTTDSLTEDEMAVLQSFQSSALRQPERDLLAESAAAPPAGTAEAMDECAAPGHDGALVPTGGDDVTALGDSGGTSAALDEALGEAPTIANAAANAALRHLPTAEELDYIPPEMKRLFLMETADDVQDLRLALLRFEQQPDDSTALAAMGRVAHKIKGAAATLGFDVLAGILYSFEDVIKGLQSRRIPAGVEASAALVREMALVQAALDTAEGGASAGSALIEEARRVYASLLAEPDGRGVPPAGSGMRFPPRDVPAAGDGVEALPSTEGESYLRVDVRRLDELMRHISALAVNRAALTQTREDAIRLREEMDRVFGQLAPLAAQLTDLQPIMRSPTVRAMQADENTPHGGGGGRFHFLGRGDGGSRGGAHATQNSRPVWDALELERFTEFDHALRKLTEVVADVDTTSRQLRALLLRLSQLSEEQAALALRMQRDVMHVRLVPLNSIVPRLELEARRLGPLTGKAVAFSVSGEMTEIDRNISESLVGPLLQLIRNAVVHGIEPPEERRELGKPEAGQIWMHAYYVGSEVIIEVGDDGRGINPHRLAASAVATGALDAETARGLGTAEALELMFRPGVTSFEVPRAVGGRGIGLDDVRTTIAGLKGSITVRNEPGRGTIFRMRVPISLSIVHVLRISAAGQEYAVPFSAVQRTLSISASALITSVTQPGARPQRRIRIERTEDGLPVGELPESQRCEEIPVFALAELLGIEYAVRDPQMMLIAEVDRRRVALLVDGVHEDLEVAVQALPVHLKRRALRGASVTANGHLLMLLDLPELVGGTLDAARTQPRLRALPAAPVTLAPRVLIVDDSVSIRRTLEHTLQRSGFEVQVARDGIEALEFMLHSVPRVMILDIEMPRIDGFELLSIVRESPRFAGVRVAMLTSRAAEKHREHARMLGAEAYLVKPCPQETLVATVRSLLTEPAAVK